MSNTPVRIYLNDATRMGTQLLSDVLRRDRRFQVVEVPAAGAGSIAAAAVHVAILFCGPDEHGKEFELIRALRALRPETKIIALMDEPQRSAVLQVFRAGARGIFCRSDSYKTLPKCVLRVNAGQVWASQAHVALLVDAIGQPFPISIIDAKGSVLLSPREQHVVQWIAEGLTNREIADRMQLSEHTVKNYLFRIFDKLGVSTRAELLLYAVSHVDRLQLNSGAHENGPRTRGCSIDPCPFANVNGEELVNPVDVADAYVRHAVAVEISNLVRERSTAALRRIEKSIPATDIPELKRRVHQTVRDSLATRDTVQAKNAKESQVA